MTGSVFESIQRIKELKTEMDCIQKQLEKFKLTIKKKFYEIGAFHEYGCPKFYISNQHGNKTVLYYTSLKDVIKDLKELDKKIKESKLEDSK